MEELEDEKPTIKFENNAEWLDDPANKIWTLGKFLQNLEIFVIKGYLSYFVGKIPTRILEEFRCHMLH